MDEDDVIRDLVGQRNRLRAFIQRIKVHLMAGEIKAAEREVEEALNGTE